MSKAELRAMRLTVVGCAGSYPGPDSPASCYLVEAEHDDGAGRRTWRILLDLGNGALGQLHRYVDPLTIDAVLISHHHPDHCQDMCGYWVMRKYNPKGPQPRIPVYGPSGTADRMAQAYDLPLDPGMREEFDFRDFEGRFELGPFTIEPILVDHPVEAYGMRVSAHGATIAYSGDSAPCEALERVAAGAQVLLCEASFRDGDDNPPHVHLTGRDAGVLAAGAQATRLVLTHIPPWFDRDDMAAEARRVFAGPLDLAESGATYDV